MSASSFREEVFSYVRRKYGSDIEYLWRRYPNYAVFRHKDNLKWYGIVMDVSRNKLGLRGNETADILNVKADSTQLADILRQREGFFTAFHMGGPKWVSILLDGTVPFDEIHGWIDMSYTETAEIVTPDLI